MVEVHRAGAIYMLMKRSRREPSSHKTICIIEERGLVTQRPPPIRIECLGYTPNGTKGRFLSHPISRSLLEPNDSKHGDAGGVM
ncbi:hypothetical protein AVEN_223016-1 [Araneus ventricosus]|uniref:Uncharacterized protein n=1 Tax=Araneus ventricosus TaxID=182803 RepID=A0A4Y2QUY8_ARAVE|nr:hypothetical protein AVEN_223016-1 [Araneus ventricosus]